MQGETEVNRYKPPHSHKSIRFDSHVSFFSPRFEAELARALARDHTCQIGYAAAVTPSNRHDTADEEASAWGKEEIFCARLSP
jgi:hypothetical protein